MTTQTIKTGSFVGFKDDIEQTGKCIAVKGNWITLSVYNSVTGERDEITKHRSQCWVE